MIDRLEEIQERGLDRLTSDDLDWLIGEIYDLRDEIMNLEAE
jgi:hypothetical protein